MKKFIPVLLLLLVLAACTGQQPASPSPTLLPPTPATIPTQVVLPSATPPMVFTATLPPATSTLAPSPAPSQTAVPTASPTASVQTGGTYAVIQVKSGQSLPVYQQAGVNSPVVGFLKALDTQVKLTGKESVNGDVRWVEAALPDGKNGWANAAYLTEWVDPQTFCADKQIPALFDQLKTAIANQDGALLSSLVSPVHGLNLQFLRGGNIANYSAAEAKVVFQTTYVMNWGIQPGSGLELKGTFHETVVPKLADVLNQTYTQACNTILLGGATYEYKWPAEWTNIHYYSLYRPGPQGEEMNWRTWLAGVEYIKGKPYLYSLVHLFWEP